MQSNSTAPSASSAPAGREGTGTRGRSCPGGTPPPPPPPASSVPGVGAQAMGRLPLPSWGISHREEVCWGVFVVNGAARWKKTRLRALREAYASQKFPCTSETRFGEISPGEGGHLLALILFSSFNRLPNLKEILVN